MTSLVLYGVAPADPGAHGHDAVGGNESIVFRELGALVAPATLAGRPGVGVADAAAYRRAVEAAFEHGGVLPAPPGTVFRSREALVRWLELHYFTLSDALLFVEDRVAARVYATEAGSEAPEPDAAAEAPAVGVSADAFRTLRRGAVATLALRADPRRPAALLSAFLVARDRWSAFQELVAEESRRAPTLDLQLAGPFPPYDFVRMQFGG